MVRLKHETQRGGEIKYQGPLSPPGEAVVLPVDMDGVFEAPAAMAAELQRILGAVVTVAPDESKRKGKGSDG